MANTLHPTAIVDPKAKLGDRVTIGPYCIVGGEVELGDGVCLKSHVVIDGRTKIGAETVIYPFASIGGRPQDLKFHDEVSTLEIGARNQIREYVTIHPGTEGGGLKTVVGDDGLFMINVHIAHDCVVGNHAIFSNNVTLAGHVTVGDYVVMGGLSAAHQFVRIGSHAMIGGMSGVENDVIPYGIVKGERAHLAGLNVIGLERRGFPRDEIQKLRSAYRTIFAIEGTMSERMEEVAHTFKDQPLVRDVLNFIRSRESRALCLPKLDD